LSIALLAAGTALAVALAVLLVRESTGDQAPRYDVSVYFSESATQADIESVGELLRSFDPDVDFMVLEIFPPIGRAVVATDYAGFCDELRSRLEGKDYVREVSCRPYEEPDTGDPDEPVSSDTP
jgi:hypothetical protein